MNPPIPLRVLLVEDTPDDAELMLLRLRQEGFSPDWVRVETEPAYRAELEKVPDLVLADWSLPKFSGLRALEVMLEKGLDIPFIIISGSIGEDAAVQALHKGAYDYLLKDRPQRLGQAVQRALERKRAREEHRQAVRALQESEERFRRLAENARDIIYRIEFLPGRHFSYISPACKAILGYTPGEFYADAGLGMQIVHPEDRHLIEDIKTQTHGLMTLRWLHRDGSIRWMEQRNVPVKDESGRIVAVEGIARDITERLQIESSMREIANRNKAILESVPDIIMEVNTDKVYTWANGPGLDFFGADVIGREAADFFEGVQDTYEIVKPLFQGSEDLIYVESWQRRRDGEKRLLAWWCTTLKDKDGNTTGALSTARDITESRKHEEALRESEERYQTLVEQIPAYVYAFSVGKKPVGKYVSPRVRDITGYKPEEWLANPWLWLECMHPEDRPHAEALLEHSEAHGSPFVMDYRVNTKDGRLVWVHDEARIIPGSPPIMLGVTLDITDRKQAEEQLRLQGAMLEAAANSIVITDAQGCVEWVNPAFTAMTGYSMDEVIGKKITTLMRPPGHDPDAYRDLDEHQRSGKPWRGEVINQRKDGSKYPVELTITPLLDAQGNVQHSIEVGEDITTRKEAEEAVRRGLERTVVLNDLGRALAMTLDLVDIYRIAPRFLERLVDCPNFAITLLDEDGRTLSVAYVKTDGEEPDVSQIPALVMSFDTPTGRAGAIMSGEPVVLDDLPAVRKPGVKVIHVGDAREPLSAAYVPMRVEGRVIGLLEVQSYRKAAYSADDVELLGTAANHIGLAIQNGLLFAETQRRLREVEAMLSLSTRLRNVQDENTALTVAMEEMEAAVGADAAAMVLTEQNGRQYTIVAAHGFSGAVPGSTYDIGDGISGHVLATRQPHISADYATDPLRSSKIIHSEEIGPAVFLPLLAEDMLLGIASLGRRRAPGNREFTQDEVRLLEGMCETTANTLQRMQLFAEVQKNLKRTNALREVEMVVAGSMDLNSTLETVAGHAISELGVDAAAVLLYDAKMMLLAYAAGDGFRSNVKEGRLRLDDSPAGKVVLEQRMLKSPDLLHEANPLFRFPALSGDDFNAYCGVPMISKGQVRGVLEVFHRSVFEFDAEQVQFLTDLAGQAAIAVDNLSLFEDLQSSNDQLRLAYDATIEGWSKAMDLRDEETEGHTRRVTELALIMAKESGIGGEALVHARRGGLLHDIGKLGVPDSILRKPGTLSPEEWELMRLHPQYARDMLWPIEYLRPAIDIPYCHHEKWDGTGYPRGLKGEEIPLIARIFALVDVWDALTSDRPYRPAWEGERARQFIREQAGRHFDPNLVDKFLKVLDAYLAREGS